MSRPVTRTLGRFIPGSTPLTYDGNPGLNKLVEYVNGESPDAPPGGRIVPRPIRMVVTVIANDYLTCHEYDGTIEATTDINVAKPPQLRHDIAWYAGLTSFVTVDAQNATVSDGVDTESWTVNLPYFVNCEIYAMAYPRGGSGVTVSTELDYIDVNIDGRKWGVVE